MTRHRTWRVAIVALAVVALGHMPARASAFPCFRSADAVASAQVRNSPTLGLAVSCGPGLSCENLAGCVFTVRIDVSGYGVLGGVISGPFDRVHCGPLPLHCSAATPPFDVPFGGAPVVCSSAVTLAVHVQLICTPDQVI